MTLRQTDLSPAREMQGTGLLQCERWEEAACADAFGRTLCGVAGPLGWSTVLTHERVAISLLSVVDVSTHIVTHQDEQQVMETELSRLANTCERMQEYWYRAILRPPTPVTAIMEGNSPTQTKATA